MLAGVAAAALAACGPAEEPGAPVRPADERLEVRERLGPEAFGFPATPHAPVAVLETGGRQEARPVLRGGGERVAGSAFGLAADEAGRIAAGIEVDEETAALPDAAFALGVQELPGEVPDAHLPKLAEESFTRRVTRDWTLERDGRSLRVAYDTGKRDGTPRYNLHLYVQPAERFAAESRPFEAGPGAVLELAWGRARRAAAGEAARFRARLRCHGADEILVVDERVDASSPPGWQERSLPLPDPGPCTLALGAAGRNGAPVRGAHWAWPRVLAPAASSSAPNLVLVSLDTLRADRLSGYGYARETSPRIDALLMARGTSFMDVTTTYGRTDVSHMSVLTGLYPDARPQPGRLHATTPAPLVTERLAQAGFQTAAFAEDALLAGAFGFWFGFDRFVERSVTGPERGVVTFADARRWLRENAARRFFLFVHTYKTHAPYASGSAYAELFRDPAFWQREEMARVPEEMRTVSDEYDRTVREADDLVAGLLDELDALGRADDTLVVLFSDHGEAFGEHRGSVGHSAVSHQEVMRVPLVLRGPGVPAGSRVETPVSLVDLAPTLVDLLGLEPLPDAQGVSLRPALEGGALPDDRPLYFSWLQQRGEGVRYRHWKYHRRAVGGLVYDLADDPEEREPRGARVQDRPLMEKLLADHAERSAAIRERLSAAGDTAPGVSPAISPDVEESLRALGYIE